MSAIETIYLDMDGVICDFRGACTEHGWIEGTKVNWTEIKAEGSKFWSEMQWTKDGKMFYEWLETLCNQEDIDLYILSAVKYTDGKIGKLNWVLNNTNIDRHHIIIVNEGYEKRFYAKDNSVLIDDYNKNCEAFYKAGGKFVKYEHAIQAKSQLMKELGLE